MTNNFRIIPSLLIENGKLIKTKKFQNPTYVGDPINAIKIFNDKNSDEIFIIDKSKNIKLNGPNFSLIKKLSSECFVPLCYGGGIRNLNDAYKIFNLGIEKISVQNIVLENFDNLYNLAKKFGSSSVIFSIDIKKIKNKYFIYDTFNKKILTHNYKSHINKAIENGAGEIYFNFIDLDGTFQGPELDFFKVISNLSISCVYQGGISSIDDIVNLKKVGVNSVAIGSYFVFYGKFKSVLITYISGSDKDLINQSDK